uniref:Uncharacterized protein n=1 Tax=Alexandrium monilatum TaxID=311494 RepID=A0A7S4UYS1_9DINO|mmetsp:Transcript_114940/g.366724  ORF Transcript_114940/g.366724 Transcript_114940/m.366724 type:complete len:882 (+) Transcript_114940:86-2731(+)
MALRLLVLVALPPLLLHGASAVSEAGLYNDGRKHVPVAVLGQRWRNLEGSSRCGGQDAQPLLWRTTASNRTVYLLATYPVAREDMLPMQPQVQNALECADVAYFELACAPKDLGHYMVHCRHYSATEEKDSVPQRISLQSLQELQAAVSQLAQNAVPECATAAAKLMNASQVLATSRQTLRAFYHQAVQVLHSSACKRKSGVVMYQESLRTAFGLSRPVFGLRDVATECAIYAGSSEQQDQALARKMAADFRSAEWRANMTSAQQAMEDILHCGDLARLRTLPNVAQLPNLGETHLGQRNQMIADGVFQAMTEQPGRNLLVVLGITHFLDFGKTASVKTLLQNRTGLTFQRVTADTDLRCTASSYSAPGARELGRCLIPPGRSQPASCDAFSKAFKQAEAAATVNYPKPNATLGLLTMGRVKNKENCTQCVGSNFTCTCEITWENSTAFADLCNRTTVEGVHGMVVYMDLTRNPGSVHPGPGLAFKSVRGLYQSCIATSCDMGFRQEIALRHWYEQDATLAGGIVTLRFPGQHLEIDQGWVTFTPWPWWAWVLFILLIGVCVVGLLRLFMVPKVKKAKRSMHLGEYQTPLPTVDDQFQKVDSAGPSRMEERPPSPLPDRYDRQTQLWEMQQMQQQRQLHLPPQQTELEMQRQQQQQEPPPYSQEGDYMRSARDGRGPDEGWPWPAPHPGAFSGTEPEPIQKGPVWQPQLDWPQLDQPSPFGACDNTILNQAMQMQQRLGDAGAQAVQQMQQQAMVNWKRQNMPPGLPRSSSQPPPGPSPLQTSGSYSLQPPPLLMPFGPGQPGQPPLSGPFQGGPPLSGAGGPPLSGAGQFPGPTGTGAPLFGIPQAAAPPSPSHGLSGTMFSVGQVGAAPQMPYPYARMS